VARAGFSWVKQQVRWDEIEGVRGAFAWKCIDDVVNQAHAQSLKVLLSVTTAPRWARTWTAGEPGPPDADLLAAFLVNMATRYRRKLHAVEVFNEPNLAVEWGDNLNPGYYVQMLIATSQAIKRVDPNIMVINAGLAPTRWNDWGTAIDDLEYMRRFGPDAAYYADCIGAHFNDGTSSPLETGSPFEQLVMSCRDLTGQSRPLCLTEFGIATPVNGKTPKGFRWAGHTTPEQQAQWLVDGIRWTKAHPGLVRLVIVWNLNYYSDDSDPNSLYSLWTPMGMRPSYDALKAVLR
jgi:polysaccharide biosynthesis protein PslG